MAALCRRRWIRLRRGEWCLGSFEDGEHGGALGFGVVGFAVDAGGKNFSAGGEEDDLGVAGVFVVGFLAGAGEVLGGGTGDFQVVGGGWLELDEFAFDEVSGAGQGVGDGFGIRDGPDVELEVGGGDLKKAVGGGELRRRGGGQLKNCFAVQGERGVVRLCRSQTGPNDKSEKSKSVFHRGAM